MYSMVYITRNLVSEAQFDTKTWQGYLKKKIAICMARCSKLGQCFESIPTKYTWSVNGFMTNTKFTSLKVIYKGCFKSFVALYANRICSDQHFVENRIEKFLFI